MDDRRFDAWTRRRDHHGKKEEIMAETGLSVFSAELIRLTSRRATVWHVGAGALASLVAATPGVTAAGKRRRKKKRKKKGKGKNTGGPTCAEACPETCEFCATRAAGPTLCGSISGGGAIECGARCDSDNDCVGTSRPYCVTHLTDRRFGQTQQPCPSGFCLALDECGA